MRKYLIKYDKMSSAIAVKLVPVVISNEKAKGSKVGTIIPEGFREATLDEVSAWEKDTRGFWGELHDKGPVWVIESTSPEALRITVGGPGGLGWLGVYWGIGKSTPDLEARVAYVPLNQSIRVNSKPDMSAEVAPSLIEAAKAALEKLPGIQETLESLIRAAET